MNWKLADDSYEIGVFVGKIGHLDSPFFFGRLMRVYKLRKRMQALAIRYCNGPNMSEERYIRLWNKYEKELRGELDFMCEGQALKYELVLQDDPRGCVIEKLRFSNGFFSKNIVDWLCQ